MIKLSKETTKELTCICGLCEHDSYDRTCPWAQMLESSNPNRFQYDRLSKLIKFEVSYQQKKATKKNTKTERKKNAKTESKQK